MRHSGSDSGEWGKVKSSQAHGNGAECLAKCIEEECGWATCGRPPGQVSARCYVW